MAINITGKFKPQGDFALVDAADVEMPDGTKLSDHDFMDNSNVSDEDNNKIAQVVDGAIVFVPVADSAVKTYVEEYIGSALEGDY